MVAVDSAPSLLGSPSIYGTSRYHIRFDGAVLGCQDESKPLREYGVTANSRVLVLGAQSAEAQRTLADEEARGRQQQERAERLQRLKLAAAELAKRSINSG
jgi:hypothetical protein